ncbi:accessory factor UbiK family protein [Propylenella binzhouense]|uniref:Accessory factor UbiK family protein n=1 Tax=Propylenella binzhouense TaxID=2555902 RepID=A0A964T6R1_9HYPH|nr:accessory factor UbiK family protein [Propylenella binzhouense]MYZ48854.1 accessory factor UbiK family protein [Propylenella binzhouense]
MTQTSSRILDEFAKLMTDAAGVAQGVRREAETAFRHQAERFLGDMNLVQREDFEVVREMAARARAEAEALKVRVAELETRLAKLDGGARHGARGTREAAPEAGSEAGTDI